MARVGGLRVLRGGGTIFFANGTGHDLFADEPGVVTHLETRVVPPRSLARYGPLPRSEPRVEHRRRELAAAYRAAAAEARLASRRARAAAPPVSSDPTDVPLAQLIARCASDPDPTRAEASVLAARFVDALAALISPRSGAQSQPPARACLLLSALDLPRSHGIAPSPRIFAKS